MIRHARDLAGEVPNLRFEVADAERLPFEDGSFTAVMCSNSLHHHPDPAASGREMARVVEPGGRIVLGDACSDLRAARIADWFLRRFEPGHVRLYRAAELAGLLWGAGCTRVRMRLLQGGGFAIVRGEVPAGGGRNVPSKPVAGLGPRAVSSGRGTAPITEETAPPERTESQ